MSGKEIKTVTRNPDVTRQCALKVKIEFWSCIADMLSWQFLRFSSIHVSDFYPMMTSVCGCQRISKYLVSEAEEDQDIALRFYRGGVLFP